MGTLFSTLDIGRAGLHVAQVQLDITGHNIANVNTPGFSRQRAQVLTRAPNILPYGAIGRGPAVVGIERLRDPFLDRVFRMQVPGLGGAELRVTYFNRLQDIFQEPGDTGFGSRMNVFFDALNDFANNVEGLPSRMSVLSEAQALASGFNEVAGRLDQLRTNANEEVRGLIPEINSLAERIAKMNETIQNSEYGGRPANDLRDQRDVLVDELARLVNITAREKGDGTVDIQLGGDELVVGRFARRLETFVDPSIDPGRPDFLGIRFSQTGRPPNILDGELAGILDMRDARLRDTGARLDEMARGLIHAINAIHSQANGLQNYTQPVTSTNRVNDPNAPLNAAGLPFPLQNGSFDVTLYDTAGNLLETRTVSIDPAATSLNDVAAQLDASPFLSASVDANGRLTLTPTAGNSFVFGNDSAQALPALGINGLFTGNSARNLGVNQDIVNNPLLLASGYNPDPAVTGDNRAALDMAAVRTAKVLSNNGQTISEFYESTLVQLGIDARANMNVLDVERAFVRDLDLRRQEVSGVNLDEEVTNLILFQRAFEASARVITVADQMLVTLINNTGA